MTSRLRNASIFVLPIVVLTALLAACTSEDETPATPAPTVATQVVGTGATPTAPAATATTPATGGEAAATDWTTDRGAVTIRILGAIPDAPPRVRPAPTPTPAGYVPPPPPTPPAPEVRELTFYVDTVTAGAGESEYNVDGNLLCTRTSAFARGMHVVWRMYVYDNSGTEVQGDRIESATLVLPGVAEPINFRYGRHGSTDDAPWFYTAAWDIPPDYPIGAIDYAINVKTKDGLEGTFKEIPVFAPDRGIESRLQVIQ